MSGSIRIERSAVENWVRLSQQFKGEVVFSQAFLAMKELLDHFEISKVAPEWMTSPSERYQAYVDIGEGLVVCLAQLEGTIDGFSWAAVNVKGKGKNKSPQAHIIQNKLPLEWLINKQHIVISEHANIRVLERVKNFPGWEVVLKNSVYVEKVDWAFLSWNTNPYQLLFEDWLALSVKPGIDSWVVTTIMDRNWMEEDYQFLKNNIQIILPSNRMPDDYFQYVSVKRTINQQIGPWLVYEKGDVIDYWALYPANKKEKSKGFQWIIR